MTRHVSDLTDFTVQSARPQQGRVQGVGSVGGHDHLDSVKCVETIHLVQQLKEHKWLNTLFSPSTVLIRLHMFYGCTIYLNESNMAAFKGSFDFTTANTSLCHWSYNADVKHINIGWYLATYKGLHCVRIRKRTWQPGLMMTSVSW